MEQFWVFGYGSLMWRPGFAHLGSEPAIIFGYHRRLCVYSHVHRGTPEAPGLVLGLDRGGSCHGLAFRVGADRWDDTLTYLRAREQVTSVYVEKRKSVRLLQSGRVVSAITYVVDRLHCQYAGLLSDEQIDQHVLHGSGVSGLCVAYVMNTVAHLRQMKIHDAALERAASRLAHHAASSSS
jgi:cation transport protein ChaC